MLRLRFLAALIASTVLLSAAASADDHRRGRGNDRQNWHQADGRNDGRRDQRWNSRGDSVRWDNHRYAPPRAWVAPRGQYWNGYRGSYWTARPYPGYYPGAYYAPAYPYYPPGYPVYAYPGGGVQGTIILSFPFHW